LIGDANEQVRGDRPEIDDRQDEPGDVFADAHVRPEIREDLGERDEVVAFEERGDAQKREEASLIRRERLARLRAGR
jgi:hypothetical protein